MFMCLAYFLSIVNNSNNKDLNYYIAKYIIENINHIGSITLQDVADGCFVSVPTVKQFLKKFRYKCTKDSNLKCDHCTKNTSAENLATRQIIGKTLDFNFVEGQLQSGHL